MGTKDSGNAKINFNVEAIFSFWLMVLLKKENIENVKQEF